METELHADLVRNYFRHFISVEIDYVQVMDVVLLHLPLNDHLHHFEDSVTFGGEGLGVGGVRGMGGGGVGAGGRGGGGE